ncbi:MAG: alpha/beta hydrolase [Alphaproteobacteria bacterium]|nr:alpha/beta hydrolase [Alphaproteobacteria bacterium]
MAIEERVYSLTASQEASSKVLEEYTRQSLEARERYPTYLGQQYGARPEECIDLFVPEKKGSVPFVAFFHGGWWKANNRISRAFLAEEYVKRGIGFASIGYPLAPEHQIGSIVASAQSALRWLHTNAKSFGLDASRIVLAGNSAGAHLATMVGSANSLSQAGVPSDAISGIIAISGLYDLRPLAGTFVEEWMQLDDKVISDFSPIHHLPPSSVPMMLVAGKQEPEGFNQQMAEYAGALSNAGHSVTAKTMDGHSHFSIIGELGRPGTALFDFVQAQI